jgi:hypothetical protein
MPLLTKRICECGEKYYGSDKNVVCPNCEWLKYKNDLEKLSIEARLERIEKIIYDGDKTIQKSLRI